jgi:hypothetical protein
MSINIQKEGRKVLHYELYQKERAPQRVLYNVYASRCPLFRPVVV